MWPSFNPEECRRRGEGGGVSQRDDVTTAAAGTTVKQLNDTFPPVRSLALLITSVLEDLFHRLVD